MTLLTSACFESEVSFPLAPMSDEEARKSQSLIRADHNSGPNLTIIIERRTLLRECIARGLANSRLEGEVLAFNNIDEWLNVARSLKGTPLVLMSTCERNAAELKADCQKIKTCLDDQTPIIFLADDEGADYLIEALQDGVKGYIPTNVALGIAVEAIKLVRAGGVFVPPQSLLQNLFKTKTERNVPLGAGLHPLFSGRQAAVVSALRKGAANKIIAHELQMAEGTVKVHVRNIMRKLKARNRTHAAFLLTQMDAKHW